MTASAQAAEFIRQLHRDADPTHLVELRVTPMDRGAPLIDRRFVAVGDPALVAVVGALLARNALEPSMVAFSVNPRARAGGSDADVSQVVAICADLDGRRAPVADQVRRLRAVARHAQPIAVVASGSGRAPDEHLHAYWRISPPCDPEEARAVGRQLRRFLDADPSEAPSKVMRLPGSLNWKNWKDGRSALCEVRSFARPT